MSLLETIDKDLSVVKIYECSDDVSFKHGALRRGDRYVTKSDKDGGYGTEQEYKILLVLKKHKHFQQVLDYYPETGELVSEYVSDRSLYDYFKTVPDAHRRRAMFCQVLVICDILDLHKINHNDIHMYNILVRETDEQYVCFKNHMIPTYGVMPVLIDFGMGYIRQKKMRMTPEFVYIGLLPDKYSPHINMLQCLSVFNSALPRGNSTEHLLYTLNFVNTAFDEAFFKNFLSNYYISRWDAWTFNIVPLLLSQISLPIKCKRCDDYETAFLKFKERVTKLLGAVDVKSVKYILDHSIAEIVTKYPDDETLVRSLKYYYIPNLVNSMKPVCRSSLVKLHKTIKDIINENHIPTSEELVKKYMK